MKSDLLTFDWAIKNFLRDKANFDILEGFLSAVIGQKVEVEELLESESNKASKQDKFNRVDVLVKTKTDERIIIEVQCERQMDYLSRILYGVSKTIAENIAEGMPYKAVKKVISITIAYFSLGHGKDYVYKGTTTFRGLHHKDILELSDKEKNLYQDKTAVSDIFPEHYILKVRDFDKQVQDKLDEWIYFLKNTEVKKEFKDPSLKEVSKRMRKGFLDPEGQKQYNAYLEQLMDNESYSTMRLMDIKEARKEGQQKGRKEGLKEGLKEGRKEGLKEGRKEGLKEGEQRGIAQERHKTALNLIKIGLASKEIAQVTGLSLKEIKALKASCKR